ncbi:MAG: CRISPR-associated protein Cas5 [Candidatus Cloacimonetes bacterium]|nr:CRISPR-associated protein Cas5 [Candidatus Cloacimonadota bacterium]
MNNRNYLVIEARSETASFRLPEYHNFHKTLPLPPPTTVAGLAGAALGLDFPAVQEYFMENKLLLGVSGKSKGFFSDLWKIMPIKSKKLVVSSVIRREFLFRNDYLLVLGGEEAVISEMKNAFLYPKYALTMGNSDSLLQIKKVSVLDKVQLQMERRLENCLVKGSQRGEKTLAGMEAGKLYRYSTFQSPQVYNLPILFDFDKDQIRTIAKRQEYSFISNPVILEEEQEVLEFDGIKIPLFIYG